MATPTSRSRRSTSVAIIAFAAGVSAAVLLLRAGDPAAGAPYTGTWSIDARPQPSNAPGSMQVTLSYRGPHGSDSDSNDGSFDPSRYRGLTAADLIAAHVDAHFTIVRDAGSLDCEGVFAQGLGSGIFTYAANPAFAKALESGGLGRPTDDEQFELTLMGTTLAFVDDLEQRHVSGLSSASLVRMAEHGVSTRYVDALAQSGIEPASVDDYVRLVDHGVDGDFASGIVRAGYHPTVEDLVRLRDHGVTLDFVASLRAHGYHPTIDDLIRLRDSGM